MKILREIGQPENVSKWLAGKRERNEKIMGFGHRVYKAYDPRARILGPLADMLVADNPEALTQLTTARRLEQEVSKVFGAEKKIFPNVDFYSGIVYSCLGIPDDMFTPIFAVGRVAGWTARISEYMEHNRIFRPRAAYVGGFEDHYQPLEER